MPNKISAIIDLLRLNRPIGAMLLFWPCAFGTLLVYQTPEDLNLIAIFLLGSFIMRAAGCIINDLWDRNIDNKVERTKTRAIAAKAISIKEAFIILGVLLLMGLGVLTYFSSYAIIASFAVMPLVIIYPLMKRLIDWPQLFLGFTFNIGVIVAALQLNEEITLPVILLYIACICWTLGYDTIYGFMDKEDDKKLGVRSLALWLENRDYKLWLMGFYLAFAILTLVARLLTKPYFSLFDLVGFIALIVQLSWQVKTLDVTQPSNCLKRFQSNNYAALITAFLLW